MTLEDLWTLPEAADLVGVEYRTAHTWLVKGLISTQRAPKGAGHMALLNARDVQLFSVLARLRRAGCEVSVFAASIQRFKGVEKGIVTLTSAEGVTIEVEVYPLPEKEPA